MRWQSVQTVRARSISEPTEGGKPNSDCPAAARKSVYARTRREVLGKLREARWAAARGLPVSSRNPTLAAFLDRWLEVIRDRVRPSTYENYELNARHGADRDGVRRMILTSVRAEWFKAA